MINNELKNELNLLLKDVFLSHTEVMKMVMWR